MTESTTDREENERRHYDTMSLYFLTCQDVLERLDTILLEIRHFQQNIIYLLHTPELYQALEFEERFLWADQGWKYLSDNPYDFESIVDQWIIPYKGLHRADEKNSDHTYLSPKEKEERAEVVGTINQTVTQRVNLGYWNSDQRAHYHNLRVLQQIKQNVFRDKLEICALGGSIFIPYLNQTDPNSGRFEYDPFSRLYDPFSRFLVLRSVMLARIRDYVDRLGDQQTVFSHSQDFGIHDHPRPNINRRRDQHLYSVHLADRCRDINREMLHLLERLGVATDNDHKLVFHRWQRDFTSKSFSFEGNLHDHNVTHHNINTSYWMPERPDLLSVIAHEVAHGIVHDRMAKLDFDLLDKNQSELVRMLKKIDFCIQFFKEETPSEDPPFEEIVVDLLSVSIIGPSYLHALFLEYIGFGLEELFTDADNPNRYNLDTVRCMENAFAKRDMIRDWYYRINVVCDWLQAIYPKSSPDHDLVIRLARASKHIVRNLHFFIERNTPEAFRTSTYWEEFSDRLSAIIGESKGCSRIVRNWLKKREEATSHDFPRSSIGLHRVLRNHIVQGLWSKKANRYDEGDANEILHHIYDNQIWQAYGLSSKKTIADADDPGERDAVNQLVSEILFRNLYDIPWQSAFLRGLDIMHKDSGPLRPGLKQQNNRPVNPIDLFKEMHSSVTLGREFYQIALDFNVHNREPSWQRLVEAIGLLGDCSESGTDLTKDFKQKIDEWFGSEAVKKIGDDKPLTSLKDGFKELMKGKHDEKEWAELANGYSAYTLAKASQSKPEVGDHNGKGRHSRYQRRLGRLFGYKLEHLSKLLENQEELLPEKLIPLRRFLAIRTSYQNGGRDKEMRDRVLGALGDAERSQLWNPSDSVMLSRICIAGSYGRPRSLSIPDHNGKYAWADDENNPIKPCGTYQALVSRFDIISTHSTRPMCRCPHPQFCDKDKRDEQQPSYFIRRELITPVRLGKKSWDILETSYIAILAITLKRAGSRLDFVDRLLDMIEQNTSKQADENNPPRYLHDLSYDHLSDKNNDRAYLSDSWCDVLLFFGGEAKKRLYHIFQTQSTIFQDFHVDRTELILTPECFNVAAKAPEQYKVGIHVRLLEDRYLSCSNQDFVRKITEQAKNQKIGTLRLKHCSLLDITELNRIPGRMDFSLHFTHDEHFRIDQNINLYKIASDCLTNNGYIDRIQTYIKLVEPISRPVFPWYTC